MTPFHASTLRPASSTGPMHKSRVGQVSQCCAAPIDEACILHYRLKWTRWLCLWVGLIEWPEGRACKHNGKGMGEEGVLSDVIPNLLKNTEFRQSKEKPSFYVGFQVMLAFLEMRRLTLLQKMAFLSLLLH